MRKGNQHPEQWPVTDEEILVIKEGSGRYVFNLPRNFYAKYVREVIRNGFIHPIKKPNITRERVLLQLSVEEALELRAWILIKISENPNYFMTELEYE